MQKSPAFQFYPDDWLGSTRITLMTPAEEGAYIRLLAHAWNSGDCAIPGDDEALAVLSRLGASWTTSRDRVLSCFKPSKDGRYINERLLAEKKKQLKHQKAMSNAGKAGADKRWLGHSQANAEAMAKNSSSSSSSSSSSNTIPPGAAPDRSSPIGLLLGLAERAKIPNAEATLRKHFDAWMARTDYTKVEQILTDPWTVGKTVNEIQDHFFPRQKPHDVAAFVPTKTKCANCGGTGKVAGAVENGAVKLVACRRCS